MSTGPPRKLAKVSNVNNNNNNPSPSARNEQLSSDDLNDHDEQVLTKGEHFNKKSKENFNYCDRTLTSLSMQQNTVIDLYKQLGELTGRYNIHMLEQDVLTKMKKELELRESECKKLIDEIQKERQQKTEQIKQMSDELYERLVKNEIMNFYTNYNIITSDKQCNTNHESVAFNLLTSHPSTANAVQNNNVVTALPLMPDLNGSDKSPIYTSPTSPIYTSPTSPIYTSSTSPIYTSPTSPTYTSPTSPIYTSPTSPTYMSSTSPIYTSPMYSPLYTDSITANMEKMFESPKRAPEESQSI